MNLIICLCIFAAILGMQAEEYPFDRVEKMKIKVKSVITSLSRLKSTLACNIKQKVEDLQFSRMDFIDRRENDVLNETKHVIAAARRKGRKVEQCYVSTRWKLEFTRTIVENDLQKCVNKQLAAVKPIEKEILSLLLKGKVFLLNFHRIIDNCTADDLIQINHCVSRKLSPARISVENYQSTVKKLKNRVKSTKAPGGWRVLSCFIKPMNDYYDSATDATESARNCAGS